MKVRSSAAPAVVPSPPKAPAGLRERMLVGISRANANYALTYLVRAGGPVAKEASVLAKSLGERMIPSNLQTAAQMTKWVTELFEKEAPALASQAHDYLARNLVSVRRGTEVEWRYGLQALPIPTGVPAAGGHLIDVSQVTKSFASDVKHHSINDVAGYVSEWLPSFAAEDLKRPGAEVWVMEGSRDGALARAARDGFTKAYRIETPGAFDANQLYVAENPVTGGRRYFFAEVSGDSSIATLLRVVGMSQVKAPVSLVSDLVTRENTQLMSAYQQLRPFSSAPRAIIGFKNGVVKELWSRKLLSQAELDLRGWAKARHLPTPPASGHIGALLDHPSTVALEGLLAQVLAHPPVPPGAYDLKQRIEGANGLELPLPRTVGSEPWDGALLKVTLASGQSSQLALLRTPYGDTAAAFVATLNQMGVKDLGVIGTAGGLGENSKVGTIYVPSSVTPGAGGAPRAFENALAPSLSDGAGTAIGEGAEGVTVLSPLDETTPALDHMRARGDDFVELELSSMVEASKGMRFSSAFVVSDVPGSKQTIEAQAPDALDDSVGVVLDGMLRSMGVADVEVPEKPLQTIVATLNQRAGAQTGRDEAERALRTLAAAAGLSGAAQKALVTKFLRDFARTPELLEVPFPLLLERGKALVMQILQAVTYTALQPKVLVPGTADFYASPETVLPLEATPLDALSIELAKAAHASSGA